MILFYNKKTGEIFGAINGRVHDPAQMNMSVGNGSPAENIGKYIIGWETNNEVEDYEVEVEKMVGVGKGLFKKVKEKQILQRNKMIPHNEDKFDILQKFEDETPENPMDYKIDIATNNLIKK